MKKITIFLTTFLLILICATTSLAADKMNIQASKTELNTGDEFTISVNFESQKENIYAYTAKLVYDQNVFEVIDKDDFEGQENWSDITYNSNNNKFALINKKGEKSENILKINFKVKDDAIPGETAININSASASDSTETIKLDGAETTVNINNENFDKIEDVSNIKEISENNNEDIAIQTERSFPWMGTVCLILCAFIICAVIIILKKNKMNTRGKAIVIAVSIVSLIILGTISFRNIFIRKSDINVDGIVDYQDSSDLIEYIIEINETEPEDITELDVNNDSVVDVTDVAGTVHDAAHQHYDVNFNSGNNNASSSENNNMSNKEDNVDIVQDQTEYNKTPAKGEEIVLDLHIEITPDTGIESVIIGDKTYPVTKVGKNNYRVKIPAPDKAGKQDIVIDGVILDNGKKVKKKYQITMDILKDKPRIDDVEIHTKDNVPEISFNVIDLDGAMKNGAVIVNDMEGNTAFESHEVAKGENIFKILNLSNEKEYQLKVTIDYDLDSDIYGNPEDNRGTTSIGKMQFKIGTEYETEEPEIYEITAKTTRKGNTKYIDKNEKYRISFEAKPKIGNGKVSYPKYIRIADGNKAKNERTYELENNKNIYTTVKEFDGYNDKGKKEIIIECVILDDGSEVPLNRNLQVEVLKDKPTLENYEVKDQQLTTITFDIKDDDGAFKSGNLIINNQGTTIQKPINAGHNEISLEDIEGTKCTITINCFYDLDEEDNQNSGMITLKTDTINIVRVPFIKEGSLKAEIVEKNKVKATFTIENAENCKKLQALLIGKDGTTLETKDLENTSTEVIFDTAIQPLIEYKVKIITSYDLNNGESRNDVELGSTTVKINVEASISNIQVDEFVKKEQIVDILFDVNSSIELDVTGLKIENETGNDIEVLSLEKIENQKYKAKMKAGSISGTTTYKITGLFYGNEIIGISENNSFNLTVLKNIPTITDYRYSDSSDNIIIMFKVNDEENAIKEGTATVRSGNAVLKTTPLQNGNMTIDVSKYEIIGNSCTLSIEGTYDLGDGKEQPLEFEDKQINISTDYQFEFSLISAVLKDGKITITFKSENSSQNIVEKIIIEGIEGEISVNYDTNSGTYTAEIPYDSTEYKKFVIKSAILNNGKQFEITENNEFEVCVAKPIVRNLYLSEDGKVTFELTDTKNTVSGMKANLIGIDGNTIETKEIEDKSSGNKEVTFDNKLDKAGKYKAQILLTYNCNDGKDHIDEIVAECEKETTIISMVTEITPDTVIKAKGDTLNVSVTVEDDTDLKVHKFIFVDINNPDKKIEHTVIDNEGDTYNLHAVLGSDAGETTYKVAEVEYENVLQPIEVSDSKTIKVDILKDNPQVEFIYDESEDKPKLSANVIDKDNAITGGTLAIVETSNFTESNDNMSNALASMTIEKNKENYEFDLQNLNLKEEVSHTALAFGQYDLDSDTLNNQNSHILMETLNFIHISNYDIKLENAVVEKVDRASKTVTITFESTNVTTDNESSTKYHVKQVEINGAIYDVELVEGNKYKVEIPYKNEETTELNITKLILDNNKAQNFEKGKYKVKIFKKAPTVDQLNVSIDGNGKVTAKYELQDEDNTVSKLYATLKNPSGEILVENKEIDTIKSGNITFDEISVTDCGKYTVEIKADYNLCDGNIYEKQLLGNSYGEIEVIADIISADCKAKYVEKGNNIEITYKITDNIEAEDKDEYAVKEIEVAKKVGDNYEEEQIYQVKEQEEENTYLITIPAPNTAGKVTYVPLRIIYTDNATTLEYSSSTNLETYDLETEIEVLKSKPEIINYSLKDNAVTFDLKDDDNAFESGKITITDQEGTDVITNDLSKVEQNRISLKELKGNTYILKVVATYNLDQEKTQENQHDNEEIYTNEIKVISDYELKFNDLKIDRIEKGDNKKAYITFVSSNVINSLVENVKVNGENYPVTNLDGDKYEVELPYDNENHKTTYKFEEVTLKDGKALKINGENNTIEIFKKQPTIEGLNISAENQNLNVQFNLIDEDNTISNIYVVAGDENQELIKKEVSKQNTISVILEDVLNHSGNFTVGIYAKLDRADGNGIQDNVLLTSTEYNEETKSKIKSHKITKNNEDIKYAEKQTDIDLIFEIEDNTNLNVLEMIINEESYIPQKQEDGQYKVTVRTPETAGNATFVVSEIKYEQKTISSDYQVNIEILKSKPRVDSYLFDDKKNITFNLIDEDNAFINGKITIKNGEETIKECEILETGEQNISLDNEIGQNVYNLQVTATYNLHQNPEETTNETSVLHESELKVITNYHLDIQNLKIENIDTESKKVKISFQADNGSDATDSQIEKIFIDGYDEGVNATYLRGTYTAEIPYIGDNYQKQRLTFTRVYLYNGKELSINDKYIEIFKEKPKVTELSGELDNTSVTFKLEDVDNTLSKIQTRLKTVKTVEQDYATLTQEIVYMQKSLTAQEIMDVQKDDGTIKVTLEETEDIKLDKDLAENYVIEVLADYENYDGDTHTNETIADNSITVPIVSRVDSCDVDKQYVEKGEVVNTIIKVTDNTTADVTSVEINGEQCYVEKTETDGIYLAKFTAPNEVGIVNLDVTKVYYENEEIYVNGFTPNDSIEVTKTIPTLEDYDPKTTLENPYISFTLKDDDGALISSHITITDIDNPENKIVDEDIYSGENIIKLDGFDDGVYYIEINGRYNKYTSTENTEEIIFTNTDPKQKVQILKGYDIQIVDLITSDFLADYMPLMISFYATNARGLKATSIKINGESYETKNRGTDFGDYEGLSYYDILIPEWKHKIGYNEVIVNSITLGNDTEVVVEKNLSYALERRLPSASNLKLEEIDQASELKATFNVLDPDNTISQLNAVLKDANGNIADSVNVELDANNQEEQEKEVIFEKTPITSRYTVELQTIYDLVKHNDDYVQETILAKSSIAAKTRAVIRVCTPSNQYPEKGENIKLNYIIENNLPEHSYITGVVVNGETQVLNNTLGNNYELNIKVPNDDGELDYVTSDILYTTGSYSMEEQYQKHTIVDVLKDKPEVTNYRVNDNFEHKTAEFTFDLDDKDGAFIDGYATIDGGETRKPINKAQNTVNFDNIEPNKSMTLQIVSNYDLDSKPSDDKNKHEETNNKPFTLISDYGLKISDIKTSDYYEKNKQVDLEFQSTNLLDEQGVYPSSIIVNGKEYNLEKENKYYITNLDGYSQAGKKDIIIDKVILNSGKVLQGKETDKTEVEVLKDKVSIYKFAYNTEDENKVSLELNLRDLDSSLMENAKIKIIDENKVFDETVAEETINSNEIKKIEFNKTGSPKYKVKVEAKGSRDIDKDEKWQYNEEIFNREFSLTDRYIEMKEIKDALLYKIENGKKVYMSEVSENEIKEHLNNYILKIEMYNMPSFYTDIKAYDIRDGVLYFTIDYEHAIQYSKDSSKTEIEVEYGALSEGKYRSNNLETLLKAMAEEPNGTFTITKDYDFTTKGNAKSIIDESVEFTGTINGNGHKFTNMSNPLFAKMKNATIKNLVIDNANVSTGARGILATTISGGTIEDVHIINSTISQYSTEGVGALIGNIDTGTTTITQCSVTNTKVNGNKRVGGILGYVTNSSANTIIDNCYENATITASSDAIGGIVGETKGNATISNCYSAGTITPHGCSGGIIGYKNNHLTSKNNIALASGTSNKFYGNGVNTAENNYELKEATGNPSTEKDVKEIGQNEINSELFSSKLGWDPDIWNFENASFTNLPKLRNSDPNGKSETKAPNNKDVYIPEYERISELDGYDDNKEILYNNLNKLMPFYDAKYLIEDARKIDATSTLNTKLIKGILAYNEEGEIISSLTTDNYQTISKIKIIYTDATSEDYETSFETYFGNIATYELPKLSNIKYCYNHYVIDNNNSIIDELTDYILKLDYVLDLDRITEGNDSRLYRENYNSKFTIPASATEEEKQKIRANIRKFVLDVLSTNNYAITSNSENIISTIKDDLINDGTLKKLLYSYNYYNRWYNINIEGMNVVDILSFHGEIFNKNLNLTTLSTELLKDGVTNTDTKLVNSYYMNYISKYTGYPKVGEFLEFFITLSGKYPDVNDWLKENFNGPIAEAPLEGHPEVNWRAWYMLKNYDNGRFLLYTLTVPDRSTYILSHPTMVTIGATRTYIKDPFVDKDYNALKEKVKNYTKSIGIWYTNTWPLIQNKDLYNNLIHFGTDTRYTLNSNGANVRQEAGTEEPFHKNLIEAAGHWSGSAGGAYAYGDGVCWTAYKCLDTYYAYTHENAHNQDVKLFMKNRGGRRGGAEDYTDSLLVQSFGDGQIQMNLNYEYANGSHIASNYTPERIDSLDKIHDYYKKLFDLTDFIDYAAAKAFLKLTPEQQSYVAVQIDEPQSLGEFPYKVRMPNDFENMKIDSMEDLWDNRIMIYPGLMEKDKNSIFMVDPSKSIIAETIYAARWYQPYSSTGVGKSCSFKYTAYEMLAQKGYDQGFISWLSNKNGAVVNDTQALQEVMQDSSITWKEYKESRYAEMQKQWDNINYIDADELVQKFEEAFIKDAAIEKATGYAKYSRRRDLNNYTKVVSDAFYTIKANTDDFRAEIFSNKDEQPKEIHVSNADEFAENASNHIKATIILDGDIDFSNYEANTNIVTSAFMGTLKGAGHTLKGNKVPIFNQLIDATIENVNIENSNIKINASELGALTRKATGTTIKNTTINNVFVTSNSNSIGGLVGNAVNCTIENVVAKKVNNTGAMNVGGLIGNVSNSRITSSYINEVTIAGTTKVGGLLGNVIENSNIEKCSSISVNVKILQDSAGGLVGEIYNSTIQNSYSSKAEIHGRSYIGGFVGYSSNPTITNCYAQAIIKANSNGAGFIGIAKEKANIQHNVSFSNVENTINKFDAATAGDILNSESYCNNYEITEYGGKASSHRNINTDTINPVSFENFTQEDGYKDTLRWSENIWDFSHCKDYKLPLLKGEDTTLVDLENVHSKSEYAKQNENIFNTLGQIDENYEQNNVENDTSNQLENTAERNTLDESIANNTDETNETNVTNEANEENVTDDNIIQNSNTGNIIDSSESEDDINDNENIIENITID